jgi:hypothetical protein
MIANSETFDSTQSNFAVRREIAREFLAPLRERLAGRRADRLARPAEARRRAPAVPDEEELRLTWFALGRGFDCM